VSARRPVDDFLSQVDDVLGPDTGAPPPASSTLHAQAARASAHYAPMRWTPDQPAQWRGAGTTPDAAVIDETHGWLPASDWERALLVDSPVDNLRRAWLNERVMSGHATTPASWHHAGVLAPEPESPEWAMALAPLAEPVDLVVAPAPAETEPDRCSDQLGALQWIERHIGLELTEWQRSTLADAMAARFGRADWPWHSDRPLTFGVDLATDGCTVVAVRETDGGAVEILDSMTLPVDRGQLERRLAAGHGVDGWAAREMACRLVASWVRAMCRWAVVRRLRPLAERIRVTIVPAFEAFRRALAVAGRALAKLGRWIGCRLSHRRPAEHRRVDHARQLKVDRAMRTLARRRDRRRRQRARRG